MIVETKYYLELEVSWDFRFQTNYYRREFNSFEEAKDAQIDWQTFPAEKLLNYFADEDNNDILAIYRKYYVWPVEYIALRDKVIKETITTERL